MTNLNNFPICLFLTKGDGPFVLTYEEQTSKTPTTTSAPEKNVEFYEETPLWVAIFTYLGYTILILFGHFRDLLRSWKLEKAPTTAEPIKEV